MSDSIQAEGFGTVKVGDVLTCRQVRRALLGPFVGSSLIDMQQEVEELHEQLMEQLEAEGIGTTRVYGRAEWLGVFDYEVVVHLKVVMFWPAKGKTVEAVQASVLHVFYAIVVVVSLGITRYIVSDVRDMWLASASPLASALPIFGVAFGLAALAFIVYQIQKSATGGAHGPAT